MKYKKLKNKKLMWPLGGSRPISAAKKIESAITNIFTLIASHVLLNIFKKMEAQDFQSMRETSRKNFKQHSLVGQIDIKNNVSKLIETETAN